MTDDRRDYYKNYREQNKEKIKASSERRKETNKMWREQNKEKLKANSKKWAEENPERRREISRKWREENKEKIRDHNLIPEVAKKRAEYAREYHKRKFEEDPDYYKKQNRKRNREKENARAKARNYKMLDYCELCGTKEKLERHHNRGYDYPEFFLTLCKACHSIVHNKILKKKHL